MSCQKCNFMAGTKRSAYRYGFIIASDFVCDKCWSDFHEGLESGRREFGALMDKGLTREQANQEMVRRIKTGEI